MKFWIVNITSFCNQKCIFCSEWDMHNNPKHIPYNKVIEILKKLKNNWVEGVNFMWGECTMRPDLKDILDYCNLNFKIVSIVTNWVMFSSHKYANDILSRINILEFSWHTGNEKKFNYLSWSNTYHLFEKWLINLWNNLENSNLWIIINHVINKINYKDIEQFVIEAIQKLPLWKKNRIIALKKTNIVWYSKKNSSLLSVSPEKVLPFLLKWIKYCIDNKIYVEVEWFPACFFENFLESQYLIIHWIENIWIKDDIYILNKIDISKVNNVDDYYKKNFINNKLYFKWDIVLNKQIILKCKKCLLRKICHKSVLLWEDSNLLWKDILRFIWYSINKDEIKYNIYKRIEWMNNILKWNI
jgi:MoaA/NifB/PqqE/SkfB family radical SAM enzyme